MTDHSPSPPQLRLDQQVCFSLYSASLWMSKLYKPLLSPLNLTYPQYLSLLVLWEQDGVTVSHLCERLSLDSGTLTPLLKRLGANGLIARMRDPHDERRVLITLTDEGRALRSRAEHIPAAIARASGCSLHELRQLRNTLDALRHGTSSVTHAASATEDSTPPATVNHALATA